MTDGALVVGYGNALRTDDGLGWHAAQRLGEDPRLAGVTILQRHQLVPELALDISAADLVVFIDASTSLAPGEVSVEVVEPREGVGGTSHHVTPCTLMALSRQLYGRVAPQVFVVSCGVQSVAMGERLSSAVEAALPRVVDVVVGLVAASD